MSTRSQGGVAMPRVVRGALGLLLAVAMAACDAGAGEADTAAAPDAPPSLVEIMRQLEVDMERVAHGVWVADFDSIAAGAGAIADHPQVGPEERAEILGILGDGAAGFREADVRVHDTAVALGDRARAGDLAGALDALTRLQQGCVSCHTGYRAAIQAARQQEAP